MPQAIIFSWSWAGVSMMGRIDVLMRLVLVLACDDIDCCVTGLPSCLSVPLTVDSISSLGSCSVCVCHLGALWSQILNNYSVDLRIITLVTLVIILESLVKLATYCLVIFI